MPHKDCDCPSCQAKNLAKDLQAKGINCEDLDEAIHEVYANIASAVNNTDLEGQITDLLHHGWQVSDIQAYIAGKG